MIYCKDDNSSIIHYVLGVHKIYKDPKDFVDSPISEKPGISKRFNENVLV